MQRTAVLNIVGLCQRHLGEDMPRLTEFVEKHQMVAVEPTVPAVTCTAQATYLTGVAPGKHGVVGNGWFDRDYSEHRFWCQSEKLVEAPPLWEALREEDPDFTCAKVFWWFAMNSTADWAVTPRPLYLADGRKAFDIHTQPMGLREQLKADLGDFPFPAFWGPMAGIPSSAWIAEAARFLEDKHWPGLSLVYLPHLDYNLQRLGPNDPAILDDLRDIDNVAGDLIEFYERRGVKVVVLSEYGITEVSRPVHLNRVFREQGWVQVKDELGRETIDLFQSQAFAIADHQLAHVYVQDPDIIDEVRAVLESTPGVGEVLAGSAAFQAGLEHGRSGDLIAVADAESWFTYYYWLDDKKAPDFARCVDIHRKCGYDPVELFLDPAIRMPKLKVVSKLLRKSLGFRALMDVIPLDAGLVRGSHGRIPEEVADWPVLAGEFPDFPGSGRIEAAEVYGFLRDHCRRGRGYAQPDL